MPTQQIPALTENAFAVLSFLAAPAILTNASTVLALGTSNRLARASDRARAASATVVNATDSEDPFVRLQLEDFHSATTRAKMLVRALSRFYLAAGCFAAGTCIALIGAFADYFHVRVLDGVAQVATIGAAVLGVGGLVNGSLILVAETRIALRVLDAHHAAITRWRATHQPPAVPPVM